MDTSNLSPAFIRLVLASPAMPQPPGRHDPLITQPSDFVWFRLTAILCSIVPGIFIILRVYTKLVITRSVNLGDYFIGIGYLLLLATLILGNWVARAGAGVHQWQLTFGQLFNLLYWFNLAEILYCPTTFFIKSSVILQYTKIFAPYGPSFNKAMFYGSWAIVVTNGFFYTFYMFFMTFYCSPRSKIWNQLQPGKCLPFWPMILTAGIYNICVDIAMLVLPMSYVWRLHVGVKRKIELSLLFGTGIVATIASGILLSYTLRITKPNADVSYITLGFGLVAYCEMTLVLIASSAITLPKIFKTKDRGTRYMEQIGHS